MAARACPAPLPRSAEAGEGDRARAAIEGVRTDLFMVSVMGSVIAWIQSSRGAEHAESVARGASFGCMEIAAVIREGGEP
jgi:hypothetical protein